MNFNHNMDAFQIIYNMDMMSMIIKIYKIHKL